MAQTDPVLLHETASGYCARHSGSPGSSQQEATEAKPNRPWNNYRNCLQQQPPIKLLLHGSSLATCRALQSSTLWCNGPLALNETQGPCVNAHCVSDTTHTTGLTGHTVQATPRLRHTGQCLLLEQVPSRRASGAPLGEPSRMWLSHRKGLLNSVPKL